jgi:2-(1,2-epoxy-1,2-dihydrophenyl)acetyl-CoA isomerase
VDYSGFRDIIVTVEDGVATFRIDRPETLNSFGPESWDELLALSRMLNEDDDVRAVVCAPEGRGFSSGAYVGEGGTPDPSKLPRFSDRTHRMGNAAIGLAMPSIDKPTIAAVDGVAAGAGMAFACSFDIRILGPGARFTTVFVRRALGPDCGLTWFLPRLVGPGLAAELLFSSREVGAEEALRIGLGNRLVDDPRAEAQALARELAQAPPLSILWTKRELQESGRHTLAEQIEFEWVAARHFRGSRDVQEGMAAFREKRTPHFTGE